MKSSNGPSLKIELGISPKTGASYEKLYKRGLEHTRLAVAACAALQHLSDPALVWRCPILVVDDSYVLVIPIEAEAQAEMEGFSGKRNAAARLRAQDAALQAAVDLTTTGVQAGAELLREVANIMDTSPDAKRELRHLELLKGADTGPARRFLMRRRDAFRATIEETAVFFESEAVRPSQQLGEPIRVLSRFVRAISTTAFERCDVLEVQGEQALEGITSGGREDFRFAELEPWQRVALAGAREAGIPFWLQAANRIGTCSLDFRPADVIRVEGWRDLYAAAMAVLQQSQFAKDTESSNDENAADVAPLSDDDAAVG